MLAVHELGQLFFCQTAVSLHASLADCFSKFNDMVVIGTIHYWNRSHLIKLCHDCDLLYKQIEEHNVRYSSLMVLYEVLAVSSLGSHGLFKI